MTSDSDSVDYLDALPIGPEDGVDHSPLQAKPEKKPLEFPVHPNFWWSILWCIGLLLFSQVPGAFVALVILVGGMLIFPSIMTVENLSGPDELMSNPVAQLAMGCGVFVAHLLIILLSILALRIVVGKDWPRKVALRLPSWQHVLLIFAMVPAFMVLANGGYYLFRNILHFPSMIEMLGVGGMEEMESSVGKWHILIGALVIGLLPGISEELWCRAFLGRGMVGRHGYMLGVLGTSFLFGAIHVDPCQGGMAMLVGIIIHLVYLASRSLLIPMLLHFLNNSLAVGITQVPEVAALNLSGQAAPWFLYASAALVLCCILAAFYQSRARIIGSENGLAWKPGYPGVECPPAGSGSWVHTPSLSLASLILVGLSLVGFAGAITSVMLFPA
ncbi:MAG: lysostaphin resistance A-like protein [Gemmataceae bacterium]